MKEFLAMFAIAALSMPALAVTAGDNVALAPSVRTARSVTPAKPATPNNRYTLHNGRYWYRAADGRWFVWTPGRWMASDNNGSAQIESLPPTNSDVRTTRTANYQPEVVTYPDDDDHNVFFGIDWYANGRGPFSD